jgi:hypothetical protein
MFLQSQSLLIFSSSIFVSSSKRAYNDNESNHSEHFVSASKQARLTLRLLVKRCRLYLRFSRDSLQQLQNELQNMQLRLRDLETERSQEKEKRSQEERSQEEKHLQEEKRLQEKKRSQEEERSQEKERSQEEQRRSQKEELRLSQDFELL